MTFGLIGYPLSHSFSQPYFTEKFAQLGLADTHRYLNFPLADIKDFPDIVDRHPDLRGINVTIPHKRAVLPFLDEQSAAAAAIGAVNTILVENGRLAGYNTDVIGFRDEILDLLLKDMRLQSIQANQAQPGSSETEKNTAEPTDKMDTPRIAVGQGLGYFEVSLPTSLGELPRFYGLKALVLGTGGASLAVHYALRELGIETLSVSRSPGPEQITYADLDQLTMAEYLLVVNTTPLGMYPHPDGRPDLPYSAFTPAHYTYDLVYNPEMTTFLRLSAEGGAKTRNGLGMLYGQAEASWAIWTGTNHPSSER